jgi:hypothetical protein
VANRSDDEYMRALSIRQPYAELILRGIKTIEFRSRPTRIIGERFYIYASKRRGASWGEGQVNAAEKIWSDDLAVPGTISGGSPVPPAWMLELAKLLILDKLPTGVIVGSAVVERVTRGDDFYEWHLRDVQRIAPHRRPARHPQPMWFKPF